MVIIGNYLVGSVLGRGKFGWVSRAKHIHLDLEVAVKHAPWRIGEQCTGGKDHFKCDHVRDSFWQESLRHEATILSSISHPAIVSLLDIISDPTGSFCICLEDLGNTSLTSFVLEKELCKVEEAEAAPIFHQVIDGLLHLHNNLILHRDIKPDNIMIIQHTKEIITAKLIDLGLSTSWKPGNLLNSSISRAGTLAYMAPELMRPQVSYESKVDVFSLGASLYFTLVGEEPFVEFERDNVKSTTTIFGLQVQHEDAIYSLSKDCKKLLRWMLHTCPKSRCDLSNANCHIWFTDKIAT